MAKARKVLLQLYCRSINYFVGAVWAGILIFKPFAEAVRSNNVATVQTDRKNVGRVMCVIRTEAYAALLFLRKLVLLDAR